MFPPIDRRLAVHSACQKCIWYHYCWYAGHRVDCPDEWTKEISSKFTLNDQIAVGYRWRGSVPNCCSLCSLYVESDHTFIFIGIFASFLWLPGQTTNQVNQRRSDRFGCLCQLWGKLSGLLGTPKSSNIDEQWSQIRHARVRQQVSPVFLDPTSIIIMDLAWGAESNGAKPSAP